MRANNLRSAHRIYAGQRLRVPTRAARYSGGTAGRATTVTTADGATVHVVRSGDTLWSIAQRHTTTITQIRRLNGLGRSTRIYPGQRLIVREADASQ